MVDTARTLLLTLLDLAATQATGRSPVVVDLPALLSRVASPARVAACTPLLVDIAQGRAHVEQVLPQIEALAQTFSADAPLAVGAVALADSLQTITALAKAGPTHVLAGAQIELVSSPLTELVTIWYLDGAPAHCVVCPQDSSRADLVVQPRGDHGLLRRLRLRYERDDFYPQIETDALLATVRNPIPAPHSSWRQHDLPDYDVQLFSEQGRVMGKVQTRRRVPPHTLAGAGLTLTLHTEPEAQLLVTELHNPEGELLLSVWRWPPVSGA